MAGPAWAVERAEMAASLCRAASAWATQIEAAAVEVLGTEMTLEGRALGLELRGQADAVLRLRDGTVLVMDYKSGGSERREKRLRAGMDVQTSLYAAMVEGARPEGVPDGPVRTGYFCLSDGVGLVWGGAAPFRGVEGDVAEHAFARLKEHLGALAEGRVPIVTREDLERAREERRVLLRPRRSDRRGVHAGGAMTFSIVGAGAGSGKTHHIQTELSGWIASDEVRPERVLAVTFTEAAAGELAQRLRGALAEGRASPRPPSPWDGPTSRRSTGSGDAS